jgi:hypothetical protein
MVIEHYKTNLGLALLAAATLVHAPRSEAGPWSSPSGTAEGFSFANGEDLNGYFGDPVIAGDRFIFSQASFFANAVNGETDVVEDVVSFDVVADPGRTFGLVRIALVGTYSVSGDSGIDTADVSGLMTFDEINGLGRHAEIELSTNPQMPVDSGTGQWSGLSVFDAQFGFDGGTSAMRVEFRLSMIAVAGSSETSEIRMFSGADYPQLSISVVPEPTPGCLLALIASSALFMKRFRA